MLKKRSVYEYELVLNNFHVAKEIIAVTQRENYQMYDTENFIKSCCQ